MTVNVAVTLPAGVVESELASACTECGYERLPGLDFGAGIVRFHISAHASGCVITGNDKFMPGRSPADAFAKRIVAQGGKLIFVDAEVDGTRVTEWDESGARAYDARNPDWAAEERRREEPGARIARWQIEELAESQIGARLRGKTIDLHFRSPKRTRVDDILDAARAGETVEETSVQGRVAFRFRSAGTMRTVFLTDDEIALVRKVFADLAPKN